MPYPKGNDALRFDVTPAKGAHMGKQVHMLARCFPVQAAATISRMLATIMGGACIRKPYTAQISAPSICNRRKATGLLLKYDPMKTPVATQPIRLITR